MPVVAANRVASARIHTSQANAMRWHYSICVLACTIRCGHKTHALNACSKHNFSSSRLTPAQPMPVNGMDVWIRRVEFFDKHTLARSHNCNLPQGPGPTRPRQIHFTVFEACNSYFIDRTRFSSRHFSTKKRGLHPASREKEKKCSFHRPAKRAPHVPPAWPYQHVKDIFVCFPNGHRAREK